jgi:hypothetical protein
MHVTGDMAEMLPQSKGKAEIPESPDKASAECRQFPHLTRQAPCQTETQPTEISLNTEIAAGRATLDVDEAWSNRLSHLQAFTLPARKLWG